MSMTEQAQQIALGKQVQAQQHYKAGMQRGGYAGDKNIGVVR